MEDAGLRAQAAHRLRARDHARDRGHGPGGDRQGPRGDAVQAALHQGGARRRRDCGDRERGPGGVLQRVLAGEPVGTLFLPKRRVSSRKRWLAHATAPAGTVHVNAGAREALVDAALEPPLRGSDPHRGRLQARRRGPHRGRGRGRDRARHRQLRGRGTPQPLLGKRTAEIAGAAGKDYEEFITRDNIVVLE